METWRIIGAAIVGVGGLLLVLVAMAQTRDSAVRGRSGIRREVSSWRVARTGLIGLVVLAVLVLLTFTVLPQAVVWTVATVTWLVLGVLILVD